MTLITAQPSDIENYLARNQQKELLRFLTCGSVDDGKSTLIGRLLHDTKGIYEDQLAAVKRDSVKHGTTGAGEMDLALLTDGLKAEREQGITIDVAYRYFSTEKRKFIIADTPGHEQYTRNMATGASNCQLAIILIDARHGVVTQTRRHSFIVSLLGIRHVVVAINKMDLVGYSRDVFEKIKSDYAAFARKLQAGERQSDAGEAFKGGELAFIPLSALKGDNVVEKSAAMAWYEGPALLEHLETVPLGEDGERGALRFPVQYVIRPDLNFRGFAGTLASGSLRRGDEVMALPSGKKSRVKSIVVDGAGEKGLEEAFAPMAVVVTLADEIDVSRGDMLVHAAQPPQTAQDLEAMVVWMHEKPLTVRAGGSDAASSGGGGAGGGGGYFLKQTTRMTTAEVSEILYAVDVNTLEQHAAGKLGLNEVGRCVVRTARPLAFDAYTQNRATGAFILIDRLTNATVAAGMIVRPRLRDARPSGPVTQREKEARLAQNGMALWVTAEGNVAAELERRLFEEGRTVVSLDAAYVGLTESAASLFADTLTAQGLIVIIHSAGTPSATTHEALGQRLVMVEQSDAATALARLRAQGAIASEDAVGGEGI